MDEQNTINSKRLTPKKRSLQSGQSLVEVAFSVTFLVMIFSGAIDLGRAYFTRITMDSAISEGTHWTAAYPGCFLYGAAFGDLSNVVNAPTACQGSNSIYTRVRNESSLLAPSAVASTYLSTPGGIPAYQVKPGQVITIGMKYNMPLITPLMRGLYGETLELTVEDQEVLRGTDLPSTTGDVGTYTPVSYVPMPTNLTQVYNDSSAACNNGYAPVSWKQPAPKAASGSNPASSPDGFEVWIIDGGSSNKISATGSAIGYLYYQAAAGTGQQWWILPTGSTTPGVPSSLQIDLKTGGSILYGIRTWDNTNNKYSDFEYILLTCTKAQPYNVSYTCGSGSPSPSITFTWQMPSTQYSWGTSQPVDKVIDGYKIIRTSDNTVQASITGGQGSATTTTLNLVIPPALPNPDPNRSATFYITAVKSDGSAVGLDNSGNALTITGTTASGHAVTTNDLSVNCP